MDVYSQQAACEAAGAAASVLADRLLNYIGGLCAGGSPYMTGGALPYASSPIGGSPAMLGTPLAAGSSNLSRTSQLCPRPTLGAPLFQGAIALLEWDSAD
ncbi:hypothetical protein NUW54_g11415 [Trametes sanguinea]|uniref:Uncharacterized protein n=1 Tax=Trametes sanguinea TaxID=158606 RepID=A0ACC1NGC8_9APHY|nr:hypothetical protein NUW54_g11415 [Trametes sanguinea]